MHSTPQCPASCLTQRLQVPGEVEAPHHATAVVSAPVAGRLMPPESGHIPHVGERVEKGQILAYIEPPLSISDRMQLIANTTYHNNIEITLLAREFDLQAKAIEVKQQLLQSRTRLGFARQTLVRVEQLRAKSLGTIADLQAASRDVELALQEVQGSEALNKSFELSRQRVERLGERTVAARAASVGVDRARHPLIAPISGEVVELDHVEGEYVEIQGAVHRVIDMTHAWIVAHISEFDLARIEGSPGALLNLASFPDRTFDVLGEMGGRIVSSGRLVDPETRTIPLRYEVVNPDGLLRAGMFADVFLETSQAIDAIAVPHEAIVRDNGQPVAFVLIHGELFQKRVLELGVRDGRFVEVLAGLQAGERVVTKGAYLVKLASASPASFGEGHAH